MIRRLRLIVDLSFVQHHWIADTELNPILAYKEYSLSNIIISAAYRSVQLVLSGHLSWFFATILGGFFSDSINPINSHSRCGALPILKRNHSRWFRARRFNKFQSNRLYVLHENGIYHLILAFRYLSFLIVPYEILYVRRHSSKGLTAISMWSIVMIEPSHTICGKLNTVNPRT